MNEQELYSLADEFSAEYIQSIGKRPVFPSQEAQKALSIFWEELSNEGKSAKDTITLLHDKGSPLTVASNDPRYFGFVIGASLPVAAASERILTAWDQCASSFTNSPIAAQLEKVASNWVLDILDLPRQSAVGFGTSATACTIAALVTARRKLLENLKWDFDLNGIQGAPEIKLVFSDAVHISVKKAARVLGFGLNNITYAKTDEHARIIPSELPILDERTILCLQAGEVNTGEFDPFNQIIPQAKKSGAWVHVDGAFGIWARASSRHELTKGIELADSWTTDGHKWLNTPYDGAMVICKDFSSLSSALVAKAVYNTAEDSSQENLTLEFSRRPRGIPIWAALRTLGRNGVKELIDRHCDFAKYISSNLKNAGFEILNRVILNQVLFRCDSDDKTLSCLEKIQNSGEFWLGKTIWQSRPAMRISISSWRTQKKHVEDLVAFLTNIKEET